MSLRITSEFAGFSDQFCRDNSNEKPRLWGFSDDPTDHHRKCGWSRGWPPCRLMRVMEALGARFVGQDLKTLIERTKGLVEWKYILIYFVLIDSYTPIFFYVGWFIVKLLRFLGHRQAMLWFGRRDTVCLHHQASRSFKICLACQVHTSWLGLPCDRRNLDSQNVPHPTYSNAMRCASC